MVKYLLLLINLLYFNWCFAQSFGINDLLTLSSTSPKSFNNLMSKRGFIAAGSQSADKSLLSYIPKTRKRGNEESIKRFVDLYNRNDVYYFVYNTSDIHEFEEGCTELEKEGFIPYHTDSSTKLNRRYQKLNVDIAATEIKTGSSLSYRFELKKKELPQPEEVRFADDLLKFTTHEYLISFFGAQNVKKDQYFFSEKEMRKCSVLFPNTSQQAVFIWDDEENYADISYILISGLLPTLSTVQYSGHISQNKWVTKSGLYSGMNIRELLELNNRDFEFFGERSEYAYMISPENTGSIDFKKNGVMLGCINCNENNIFLQEKVSAADALQKSLMLYVFYIMVFK